MSKAAALMLLSRRGDRRERRDYRQRPIDQGRISKAWYAVICLTVPVLSAGGTVFDPGLGGGADWGAALRCGAYSRAVDPLTGWERAPDRSRGQVRGDVPGHGHSRSE